MIIFPLAKRIELEYLNHGSGNGSRFLIFEKGIDGMNSDQTIAQKFERAFKAGDVKEVMILLADEFESRDTGVSDEFEVLCFMDGSKAGWKRDGDVWEIGNLEEVASE